MAAPHPLLLPLITGDPGADGAVIDADVAASATEHYVGALVHEAARERAIPMTESAARRLAMDRMASEAQYAASETTLAAVLDAASGTGVRLASFKGIVWATQWYADPKLRPSIDVDVAVHPGDLDRIGDLVRALGADEATASGAQAMVAEGRVFELTLDGPAQIDVHRDPANLLVPITRTEELWPSDERFLVLTSAGAVETFDLEWSILVALLHGLRDNFADLLHINDIRLMLDRPVDWGRLEDLSDAEGWTDLIRFAMAFVADVLDTSSPLPTVIRRSAKVMFDAVWPRSLLLGGAPAVERSHVRQSALSTLIRRRTPDVGAAYVARFFPPRTVIDARSGLTDSAPYPLALLRWRASQRRALREARDQS